MESLRHDRTMQQAGCDRRVVLADGSAVLVEEKVRHARIDGEVYEDVLIEVRSDADRGTPGWILKREARCDWLVYVNLPAEWVLFLPWAALRDAYEREKWAWAGRFGSVDSPNETDSHRWTTRSIPVPVQILKAAVTGSVLVEPFDTSAEAVAELTRGVPAEARCGKCGMPDERAVPALSRVVAAAGFAYRPTGAEFCGCPF